jgi:hypothetical protein
MQDTERLEVEILARDEKVVFFTVESDLSSVRVGCFTQTREERDNLLNYGDVISDDGTTIDNDLRWDAFPITLDQQQIQKEKKQILDQQ